jgi:hypothetical protein
MFDGMGSTSAAMERVINSSSVELPLLTKANYHEWALVMQVSLEAMELGTRWRPYARSVPRIGGQWPPSCAQCRRR